MLCSSRQNPKLSVDTVLNGIHDFNKEPMAPLGTKVLVHETPEQRRTSAVHGQEGYCIGSAPNHYRCYQVYISSTNGIRIAETVEFFPTHYKMPTMTAPDKAISAATQLIVILQTPQPNSSFPIVGDKEMQALSQLAQIFQDALPKMPLANTPLAPRVEKQPALPAQRVEEQPSPSPTPQTHPVPHQCPLCWNMLPMLKHGWLTCQPSLHVTRIIVSQQMLFSPFLDLTINPLSSKPMHQKYGADSSVVISSLYNFTSLSNATTSLLISLGYEPNKSFSS